MSVTQEIPWRDQPYELGGHVSSEKPQGKIFHGTSIEPWPTKGEVDDRQVAKGYPSRDPAKQK